MCNEDITDRNCLTIVVYNIKRNDVRKEIMK